MLKLLHRHAIPLLFLAVSVQRATAASITDLGTLGGSSSYATAINASGEVVGYSNTASQVQHAFAYSGGVMTDLGTFGGYSSAAYGINAAGQIVGEVNTSPGKYSTTEAFLYSGGSGTIIGNGDSVTGQLVAAYGINSSGQIAGAGTYYAYESGAPISGVVTNAYIYSGGVATNLGWQGYCGSTRIGNVYLCGSSASAINDSGQIVGVSYVNVYSFGYTNSMPVAAIYSNGTITDIVGGAPSGVNAISNSGLIAGYYTNTIYSPGTGYVESSSVDGFVYSEATGSFTDLGVGDSLGVNDQGQVVGYLGVAGGIDTAFLYSGAVVINLNSLLPAGSGWQLTSATAINDAGQIVGEGVINGQDHAFLMNLQSTSAPEPASLAMLGAAAVLLVMLLVRRF